MPFTFCILTSLLLTQILSMRRPDVNRQPTKRKKLNDCIFENKFYFTSVAVMQLWEQGKVRLDDSISALLPAYNLQQQYEETVPITVRSLLTHSSGLPREADYPYWSAPDFNFPTEKEVNDSLGRQLT